MSARIQRTHNPAALDFSPGSPPSAQDLPFDYIGLLIWVAVGAFLLGALLFVAWWAGGVARLAHLG